MKSLRRAQTLTKLPAVFKKIVRSGTKETLRKVFLVRSDLKVPPEKKRRAVDQLQREERQEGKKSVEACGENAAGKICCFQISGLVFINVRIILAVETASKFP